MIVCRAHGAILARAVRAVASIALGGARTRPVIYIVTGAGGSRLYSVEEGEHPRFWKPFTARLVSDRNSFTVADVRGDSLTLRQLSNTGEELDRVLITRTGQPSTRTIRYIAR